MPGLLSKRNCARRKTTVLGFVTVMLAAQMGCQAGRVVPTPPAPDEEFADIWGVLPERAVVEPNERRRLLVFSRCDGFAHEAIGATEAALTYMGRKTGAFEVTVSTDMAVFEASSLARFDAVLFNNTTQLEFEDPNHRRALLEFVRSGKGVIGIHAATDNFYNWPEAAEMMGGLFDGHPWHAGGTWAMKIDEPDHPLNRSFGGQGFLLSDEIYQIKGPYSRDTHRVLLSLDMSNPRNRMVEGINRDDADFAISWIKPFGEGRVFYCSLGHNLEVLRNEAVLAHYLAGIQYALGDLEVDDAPSNAIHSAPVPATTTDSGAVEDPFREIVHLDFGSSRLSQAAIENIVRNTTPSDHAAIEDRLIAILDNPSSTYAATQFVCRMLRRIGPNRSLPHLARMLLDEELTDDARFALQGHESPEVDRILRESLGQLSGTALLGVIGTIGLRHDGEAVHHLAQLIDPTRTERTSAIITALGHIGNAEAREALSALELPATYEPLRLDALLRCADRLLATGDDAEARDMYRRLMEDEFPMPVRIAAWRGLVRAEGGNALPSLLSMLRSDEPEIQRAGARFMTEVQETVDLSPVAGELISLPESARMLAISALASAGVRPAVPVVTAMVETATGPVRTAAIKALGDLGGASHVSLLARIAVSQDDSTNARQSLVRLHGEGVDENIISAVNEYENEARAVLIDIMATRYSAAAVPTFLTYAQDRDASVRLASIGGLSRLAEDHRLPDMLTLLEQELTQEDRLALEEAIGVLCERMEDRGSGLNQLREVVERGVEQSRESLRRILGDWPDNAPLDLLLELAGTDTGEEARLASIAGVLKLMDLPHERTSADDESLFQTLFDLTQSNDEKELVLDGLAGRSDVWAFGMVEPLLTDPDLAEKATAIRVLLVEAVARTVSHDGAGRPVTLATPPADQYDGGGENALTDDRWGSTNVRDGTWLGFEGQDLDAVIDLGQMTDIRSIRAGFLEANGSWIFLPQEVTFSIAGGDRVFETVETITIPVPDEMQPNATRSFSAQLSGKTARYVRVVARNIGTLPAWHGGAGGLAWLFADEIQINAHLEQ